MCNPIIKVDYTHCDSRKYKFLSSRADKERSGDALVADINDSKCLRTIEHKTSSWIVVSSDSYFKGGTSGVIFKGHFDFKSLLY